LRFEDYRARSALLLLLALGLLAPAAVAEEPEPPKTFLILLPGQPILPTSTLEMARGVRAPLVSAWGSRVSIHSEYVDVDRYQDTDVERRIRDAFRAKYAGMTLDAIVAVGPSPLGFLARWGRDLWPAVPVVVAAVDELWLNRLELPPKVTAISMRYDVEGTVRLALRLLPETRHVALISGVSPQNRLLADLHRARLGAFADRLELIDLTGLSVEDMLARVATLPDRSILLVSQIWIDGAGRSLMGIDFLPRISAAANCPVFSVFGATVGAGTAGSSVADAGELGAEAGRVAIRVVRGEAVPSLEASEVRQRVLVDWRQLRRWGLDEGRLPSESRVLFRTPTLWEEYRWAIVSAFVVVISQTVVVVALLFERRRRRLAQGALEERLRFETVLTEISAGFASVPESARQEPSVEPPVPGSAAEHQVREGLRRVAETLGAEGASLWRFSKDGQAASVDMSWMREDAAALPASVSLADFPYLGAQAMRGEAVQLRSLDELPAEASVDRRSLARDGIRSLVVVPFGGRGGAAGARWCLTIRNGEAWPEDVVQRLQTIGEIFAATLARGRAESALHRSEALNRAVLASLPSALAVIDRDGVIIHVNEEWTAFAREHDGEGTSPLSVGANYLEACRRAALASDQIAGRALELIESVLRGRSEGETLEYPRGEPGDGRWFEMDVRPLDHPGGEAVILHREITPRKRAEEEARRTLGTMAHLERVAAVGQLASALAHELNQPLTAILANAEATQEWLAAPAPDLAEVREAVADIVAEDVRASEVIRRMRELLKKGELRSDAVDLNEVVREVTRLIANDALLRGTAIECDLSPALPKVRGDAVQFQQVLLNLFVNGLHAVAEGPPTRRRVIVRTGSLDGGVEVSVRDTGKGIAESDLQQVFTPFFSTKGEGLGVGLSISRSIVETYGGRIWAENDPDGGAIFRVRLPVSSTAPGPPEHTADLPG
jgi:signal transduction histidine kinase